MPPVRFDKSKDHVKGAKRRTSIVSMRDVAVKTTPLSPKGRILSIDFEVLSVPGPEGSSTRYPTRITIVDEAFDIIYNRIICNEYFLANCKSDLYVHGLPLDYYTYGVQQEIAKKEVEELVRGKLILGYGIPYLFELLALELPRENYRDIRTARIFNGLKYELISEEYTGLRVTRKSHSTAEFCDSYLKIYNQFNFPKDAGLWKPLPFSEE